MELFRTIVPAPVSEKKISYNSRIMFSGSCFSEYIGNKLAETKFIIDNNPFGVVYNPLSVRHGLMRLLDPEEYTESDLFLHEHVWNSFDHHSRFSGIDMEMSLKNINQRLKESSQFLKNADFLFITFGTSYVYLLKSTKQIISNCHKLPANLFLRNRLGIEEIIAEYNSLLLRLWEINPNIQVIFTVSPIRHWKDGAHDNQLSKAILLLAIDAICNTHKQTFYFPSYEIILDDLRDYRYYDEDMLHPNKTGINYVWKRFRECFLGSDTASLMKEVEKVVQARKHRPVNPGTEAFQSFAQQIYDKIQFLKDQYRINLTEEESYFQSFLK